MRYYSEDDVIDIMRDVEDSVTTYEWGGGNRNVKLADYPSIEIPDEHGRLIDADVIGNWLREQHVFSMPTTCKIDSIIKDAPTIIEASN